MSNSIKFPEKLDFLFQKKRYKIIYGGRGGAKSWSVARALLIKGAENTLRILCAREVQKSIKQSVHTLLSDQIKALGLTSFYSILDQEIRGINGTNFSFTGLMSHTTESIKSFEGCDIVWVEEAKNVSKSSWQTLIPTIRKDDSEIWITFNPELDDDETYQRFVADPPENSIVAKIGWQDNPWFNRVLEEERCELLRKDPKEYAIVYDGECRASVDGAVFAEEIALAMNENRITIVKPVAGVEVHTFWDLGQSDNTAIWFIQIVGLEYRIIDYYQKSGQKIPHYIEQIAKRSYLYGEHYLPHDADHEQQAAQSTIKDQVQLSIKNNPALGRAVKIVPRIPKKALGINAARQIFGQCLFDKVNTVEGVQCLKHYAYERDEHTGRVGKEPKHDIWSHGSDAFLCFAQYFKRDTIKKPSVSFELEYGQAAL